MGERTPKKRVPWHEYAIGKVRALDASVLQGVDIARSLRDQFEHCTIPLKHLAEAAAAVDDKLIELGKNPGTYGDMVLTELAAIKTTIQEQSDVHAASKNGGEETEEGDKRAPSDAMTA